MADLLVDNKHLLYSQWFPGSSNFIPDILSIDWHLDDSKILNLLTHIFPTQMHPYFRLSRLPSVINSFLCLVLQSLPKPTQTWTKPKPGRFTIRITGVSSCDQLALEVISFWMDSAVGKYNSYCLPSHKLSEQPNFCKDQRKNWFRQQSEIPLDTCLRPSKKL